MPQSSQSTPWKSIAIVLAILLVVVVICMTLVVTGVMNLGFSLF
ncbi:MAG TPA: hypothetical protein VLD66_07070 [Methyloceanibacter sp.]|nr:hypothetical protein [Methyloceanibacter sp.]